MRGSRFSGLLVVAGYLGLGLLGTALIGGLSGTWLAAVAKVPIHRLLDRLFLSLTILLVVGWEGGGLLRFWARKGAVSESLAGALVGLGSVVVAIILGMALDGWTFLVALPGWGVAGKAALAVLFVPFLEETFFRGLALETGKGKGKSKEALTTYLALILAALLYSTTHFWRFPVSLDGHSLSLPGAFGAVGDTLMASRDVVSWRGLNLGLIGLILGLLYLRTGRLWASWAVHAVFILALFMLPIWVHGGRNWQSDLTESPFVSISLGVWVLAVWAANRGKR